MAGALGFPQSFSLPSLVKGRENLEGNHGDQPVVRRALTAIAEGAVANALESDTLEFKTQGRSVPETLEGLAEATACLANARGGMVVVGVADGVAGTDAFVGCDLDPMRTQRRIFELTDPHLTATVDPCDWRGRPLLIVTVPVSPDVHAVAGRITERIGGSCQPMSTSRIRDRGGGPPRQRLVRRRRRNPPRRRRCRCARPGPHELKRSSDPQRRDYARRTYADPLRMLGVVTPRNTLTRAGALLFSAQLDVGDQLSYVHRRTPLGRSWSTSTSTHPCFWLSSGCSTSSTLGWTAHRSTCRGANSSSSPTSPRRPCARRSSKRVMHRD